MKDSIFIIPRDTLSLNQIWNFMFAKHATCTRMLGLLSQSPDDFDTWFYVFVIGGGAEGSFCLNINNTWNLDILFQPLSFETSWYTRTASYCLRQNLNELQSLNTTQIWTARWFIVTFSFPSWRSLNFSKRSLNHPKKVTKNYQLYNMNYPPWN